MLKLYKIALMALVGLGMVSANAADSRFDAFMQTVVGNNTTINFGGTGVPVAASSAPLGTPSVQNMGFTKTAEGVFMESIGAARVGGANTTVPIKSSLKLSGKAIGIAIAKTLPLISTAWALGEPIYDALKDNGLNPCANQVGVCELNSSNGYAWRYNVGQTVALPQYSTVQAAVAAFVASVSLNAGESKVLNRVDQDPMVSNPTPGSSQVSLARIYVYIFNDKGQNTRNVTGYLSAVYRYDSLSSERVLSEQEVIDQIAQRDGWADSTIIALQKSIAYPQVQTEVAPEIEKQTAGKPKVTVTGYPQGQKIQIGDPVVETSTETLPDGKTRETTKTTVTTITAVGNELVTEPTTTTRQITKTATGEIVGDTTTTSTAPQTSGSTGTQPELKTCGLPDTPACKIDETGTPEKPADDSQTKADTALQSIKNCLESPSSCLPSFPELSWSFSLPSGCSPIAMPAFAPYLSAINVCEYQPIIHDLMSMVWAATGLFVAVGMMFRDSPG